MQYTIYQVKDFRKCCYAFCGWEIAKACFTMNDYKKVYAGCIDCNNYSKALNSLYEIFNIRHPKDFRGHSMSVGDVIVLRNTENSDEIVYYCDSFGWEDITKITNIPRQMTHEEMIDYLLGELKEEKNKMLHGEENKYSYIFMLCNDMGILEEQ